MNYVVVAQLDQLVIMSKIVTLVKTILIMIMIRQQKIVNYELLLYQNIVIFYIILIKMKMMLQRKKNV